jgi:hypothetical protein
MVNYNPPVPPENQPSLPYTELQRDKSNFLKPPQAETFPELPSNQPLPVPKIDGDD